MATRGNFVTQSEMDALAALANSKLLPLVNAQVAAGTWPGQYYDYYSDLGNTVLTNPQPNYSFPTPETTLQPNLVPANAVYNSSGQYNLTIDTNKKYIFRAGANDYFVGLSGQTYKNNQLGRSKSTPNAEFFGAANMPVTSVLFEATSDWMQEINRIRSDFWQLVFGKKTDGSGAIDPSLYLTGSFLSSGPWCVGVNDPATFPGSIVCEYNELVMPNPVYTYPLDGMLFAGKDFAHSATPPNPTYTIFKDVSFLYAADDAASGLTLGSGRFANLFQVGTVSGSQINFSLAYTAAKGGAWNCMAVWYFYWTGTGVAPSMPPPASSFSPTSTGATATFTTASANVPGFPGNFYLIANFTKTLADGDTGTVDFQFNSPITNYQLISSFGFFFSQLIFSSSTSISDAQIVHPGSKGKSIAASDIPAASDFVVNGIYSTAFFVLSQPELKGVWSATTLPSPGMNCYVGQDMPPYVGATAQSSRSGVTVAVAGNLVGGGNLLDANGNVIGYAPIADSARELSPAQSNGLGDYVSTLKNVEAVAPGITDRPTLYLSLRDTDFVNFDYGFNSGNSYSLYGALTLQGNGGFSSYPVYVPNGAVLVQLRIVKSGTAADGWENGQFQNGTPLTENLTIYFSQSGTPNPTDPSTYDFFTNNNAVTIPTDGGAGYISEIQNVVCWITIANPNTDSLSFDMVADIYLTENPVRQYFPAVNECYSYCFSGDGRNSAPSAYDNKPIPQSGYSIFKIRATRLPQDNGHGIDQTPSSGSALTITVGQNILQPDGSLVFTPFLQSDGVTPFTVLIPSNARDSGDVEVFWPVLSGNEIVWQCPTQIIFESWVNFQPIFWNTAYALPWINFSNPYSVMNLEYCLNFQNYFNVADANYPVPYENTSSSVQFPLSAEIYNDLQSALNLIS